MQGVLTAYLNAGARGAAVIANRIGLGASSVNQIEREARDWVDGADTAARPRRLFAFALFAIEWADSRLPDAWRDVRALVARACALLREQPASEAERLWHLAAISLAHGARDWNFLDFGMQSRLGASPRPARGLQPFDHLPHARKRFPRDPEIAFAAAVTEAIHASPFWQRRPAAPVRRSSPLDGGALAALAPFMRDEHFGAEANLWTGLLLLLQRGEMAPAMRCFEAASHAADSFVAYLARYAAGRAQQGRGDADSAIAQFRAALADRPGTQSALVSLASLLHARGDAAAADDLAQHALRQPAPFDPFQWYGFGWYYKLGDHMERVRREIGL